MKEGSVRPRPETVPQRSFIAALSGQGPPVWAEIPLPVTVSASVAEQDRRQVGVGQGPTGSEAVPFQGVIHSPVHAALEVAE